MPSYDETHIQLDDGYRAYARWWPVERPRGAVLYLHGIQSHCGWYEDSARRLQAAGFAVLQPDRRGSGRNDGARGHAASGQQLVADGLCCGRRLMEYASTAGYHLLGVSWGGKLACALYMHAPAPIASLQLACPGLFPLVDVSRRMKVRIGLSCVTGGRTLYDIPLNDPTLFTSQAEWQAFLERDTLRLHQVSASFLLASRRLDHRLRGFGGMPPVPVALFVAGRDQIIDSVRTAQYFRGMDWPWTRIINYPAGEHTLEFDVARESYFDDLVDSLEAAAV